MFLLPRSKAKTEEHRLFLVELYEDDLRKEYETTFMKEVLKQALRYLKMDKPPDPRKIERWVVGLERSFRRNLHKE